MHGALESDVVHNGVLDTTGCFSNVLHGGKGVHLNGVKLLDKKKLWRRTENQNMKTGSEMVKGQTKYGLYERFSAEQRKDGDCNDATTRGPDTPCMTLRERGYYRAYQTIRHYTLKPVSRCQSAREYGGNVVTASQA
jgi:hypothetical protein